MSAVSSQTFELRPAGGIQVKNSKGELIFWFKGKDPEGMQSFALCLLRPELADTPEKAEMIRATFAVIAEGARRARMPIFDAKDLERQMRKFIREMGSPRTAAQRTEDITVRVREMTSGRRLKLTLGVHPADKNGLTVLPPKWFESPV
jgi:hypothetical protein